jgi:MFS transporter, MHS family, proline/betaine transporter
VKKQYWPVMLGTGIEYYDTALYGFMAPVLMPIFMPAIPPMLAYFLYFFIDFMAACAQYLGARYFGNMGDTRGRVRPLYYTVFGTSFVTFLMCVIPVYAQIGLWATILFAAIRMIQNFFLGGEFNGGAIYCLEHESNPQRHGWVSGLYGMCTVIGILIASFVVMVVNEVGGESTFRWAYLLSLGFAVLSYSLRRTLVETPAYKDYQQSKKKEFIQPIASPSAEKRPWGIAFRLVFTVCFFGILYGIPTRLFNVILPEITTLTMHQVLVINTVFLFFYLFLLMFFGKIADRFGAVFVIKGSVLGTILLAVPLMLFMTGGSFMAVLLIKGAFTILTAAFAAPLHVWTISLFAVNKRYKGASTSYAIGKCLSTLLLASSLLLFQKTQSIMGMGGLLVIMGMAAFMALSLRKNRF